MRDDPDNDLNEQPRCPTCRAPYVIEGKGNFRHLVPNHKPWCRWKRRTTTATNPKEKAA